MLEFNFLKGNKIAAKSKGKAGSKKLLWLILILIILLAVYAYMSGFLKGF